MNHFFTKILRGRKVLMGRDFYQFRQVKRTSLNYGNRFADWTFCPIGLDDRSLVYSFGVGEDISFDLRLMEQFHMPVHAFDPSPRSISWMEGQDLPEGFHFYPYGLAAEDGQITFNEPVAPGIHSLQISESGNQSESILKTHHLQVHRLPTILRKLGHEKIDILKMDIEGAEYGVLDDIIASPVPIFQVLIEFHHRFEHIGIQKSKQAISKLNKAGYKIFNVSDSGEEISFIRTYA